MMDPFSIIAGVIGITSAAIQSSKAFFELVNAIKGCPAEIQAVSRDVHAFYAIVFSLNAILKEVDVKNVISCDEAMVSMITNLANPLENCQMVLGELMIKIQKRLKHRSEGKGFRMSATYVKWSLCTRSEIRDLQRRLEATKSTLCSALDAVTTYVKLSNSRTVGNTDSIKTL
jgi:Fungal N-terminal domain of STAND proteins